jgi:hypothetical protein
VPDTFIAVLAVGFIQSEAFHMCFSRIEKRICIYYSIPVSACHAVVWGFACPSYSFLFFDEWTKGGK